MFFKWLDKLIERKIKRELAKHKSEPVWFTEPKNLINVPQKRKKPINLGRSASGETQKKVLESLALGTKTERQISRHTKIRLAAVHSAIFKLLKTDKIMVVGKVRKKHSKKPVTVYALKH